MYILKLCLCVRVWVHKGLNLAFRHTHIKHTHTTLHKTLSLVFE